MAIEYDGLRWHSTEECIERDRRKELDCLNNNISIIRIDERLYRSDKRKNVLFENIKNIISNISNNIKPKVIKINLNKFLKKQEIKEYFIENYQN